ncbi:MAG: hypothetical protein ACLFV2_06100 [Desulfurivibrionaceae bacterium]
MMKRTLTVSAFAAVLIWYAGPAIGADQGKQIYGNQLMTQQERNEYRTKMRNAESEEERERIRREHHEKMKDRARSRGLTLPDKPPVQGDGIRPGNEGMGPGGRGMGTGGGRGR